MLNKYVVLTVLSILAGSIYAGATTAPVTCVCTSYGQYGDGQFGPVVQWVQASSLQVTPEGETYIAHFTAPSTANSVGFWLGSNVFKQADVDSEVDYCMRIEKSDPSLAACALVVPPLSQWEK